MDEEIKSLYFALDKEVVHLCAKWKLYNQLFRNDESINLLNKSGSYVFHQLQILITDHVFLILSRLTDPAKQRKNENMSLYNLLERTKGIFDSVSWNKYKTQLEKLEKVCENMKTHRNKRIAHSDINHAIKENTDWLPTVMLDEIEDVLTILRNMMEEIMLVLFNLGRAGDPSFAYGTDGNYLLYILHKAHSTSPSTDGV